MHLIEIPVKPYIKTFLITRFGCPADMTRHSYIGKHFYLLLNNQTNHKDKHVKLSEYTEKIAIRISEDVFYRHGYTMTPTSVAAFNTWMEDVIKEQMSLYIETILTDAKELYPTTKRIKARLVYDRYITKFGFMDGSFEFEAIKKSHQRMRKRVLSLNLTLKINQKKIHGHNVPKLKEVKK